MPEQFRHDHEDRPAAATLRAEAQPLALGQWVSWTPLSESALEHAGGGRSAAQVTGELVGLGERTIAVLPAGGGIELRALAAGEVAVLAARPPLKIDDAAAVRPRAVC